MVPGQSAGDIDGMSAETAQAQRRAKFQELFDDAAAAVKDNRLGDAVSGFNKALSFAPRSLRVMRHLGDALFKQERYEEALACFRRALDEKPDHVVSLLNLGLVLRRLWRFDEAAAALERAHGVAPRDTRVLFHLALSLKDAGRLDEAMERFRQTVEIKPDHYDAAVAFAMCLMLAGNFRDGWTMYEVRWQLKITPTPRFTDRKWEGERVNAPVLLSCEQGFGDTVMFARYARIVRERCTKVILECPKQLARLMADVDGIDEVAVQGQALPPFARHAYLMSLPRVLGTTPETIPAPGPYLNVRKEKLDWAANMMKVLGPLVRVGVAWAGNPKYGRDRERSIAVTHVLELLEARGVALLSLQKGETAKQLAQLGCAAMVSDLDRFINDFTDTAAIVSQLDIVVTCDSVVAHVAGALGVPVWVALPYAPDWRWLLGRTDSPWYPSMRLFRQPEPGDWTSVYRTMGRELARFADEVRARRS